MKKRISKNMSIKIDKSGKKYVYILADEVYWDDLHGVAYWKL